MIDRWLEEAKVKCVDGMLIDAGVSSMQLDRVEKGFSFQTNGPLDMRMDQEAELTAERIVNRWREEDLVRIFQEYGEEPRSRAIARAIVAARKVRPIRTTQELVSVIRPVARGKKHLHPATLTFQALRIAVNDELKGLEESIEKGIAALCPMGRLAVISFHRLEDRIAKNCLKKNEKRSLKKSREKPMGCLEILTKKPIGPQEEEINNNPRCRSAKLRAAKKVEPCQEDCCFG
jgi:16S rRNA (cytosine1402-N4)-methyltransferase